MFCSKEQNEESNDLKNEETNVLKNEQTNVLRNERIMRPMF